MVVHYNKSLSSNKQGKTGGGLLNSIIDSLPIELHLPGYQFCGPGTKLQKRLIRGDKGINGLDAACREHDIAYAENKDLNKRHQADKILAEKAWERYKAEDSSFLERINSWLVSNAMKSKRKMGMGIRDSLPMNRSRLSKTNKKIIKKKHKNIAKKHKNITCGRALFKTAVSSAQKMLNKLKPDNIDSAIKIADKAIKKIIKRKKVTPLVPRVLPVPKVGGFLPLIPMLTALSAIGGLASGGSAIAKTINEAKSAKEQFNEAQRHNKVLEAIAIGGKGLYLKPYRKGYGLYYRPQHQQGSKNF